MNSLYNQGERVDITRSPSDALLVIDSADRSTSTSATGEALALPSTQPYNNFRLQRPQNLIQGGFTRLQLTEINFPYAIPNINSYTNSFWVQIVNPNSPPALITQKVEIPNNYYSGRDLAGTLKGRMNLIAAISTDVGITWDVQYLPESETYVSQYGGFVILAEIASTMAPVAYKLFPCDPNLIGTIPIPAKSMLNVMGFNPLTNWAYCTNFSVGKQSLYAPLTYTSYIDVVSSKLTYYQRVQDSSSKTTSFGNIICRIYVANETSDAGSQGYYYNGATDAAFNPVKYIATLPPGSAPFLIHRQFMCPKSFRWDMNQAVDWLDIKLYDDAGQPLFYSSTFAFPDFQITFKCTED
jgi:hypothetical protein